VAGFSTIFWKIHGCEERRAIFKRISAIGFRFSAVGDGISVTLARGGERGKVMGDGLARKNGRVEENGAIREGNSLVWNTNAHFFKERYS
jgi:hypothetical protein